MLPVVPAAICTVFTGCQVNVFALELLVQHPQGKRVGFALTFLQFLFISIVSCQSLFSIELFPALRLRLRPLQLQKSHLVAIGIVFWLTSVINNVVFRFDISVPIHTIFRSSSLIANIFIGFFFFKKTYSLSQILCAVTITVGLIVLTLATAQTKQQQQQGYENSRSSSTVSVDELAADDAQRAFWWMIGVVMLLASVILSTLLGLLQDRAYTDARRRAAHAQRDPARPPPSAMWQEALFASHFFTLPLYLVQYSDLGEQFAIIPSDLYGVIAVNIISQYICITGVYVLSDRTSAFTMTLVITLRKFFSLVISVFYFKHYEHFSYVEWVSIVLVLLGGTVYPFIKPPPVKADQKKKQ